MAAPPCRGRDGCACPQGRGVYPRADRWKPPEGCLWACWDPVGRRERKDRRTDGRNCHSGLPQLPLPSFSLASVAAAPPAWGPPGWPCPPRTALPAHAQVDRPGHIAGVAAAPPHPRAVREEEGQGQPRGPGGLPGPACPLLRPRCLLPPRHAWAGVGGAYLGRRNIAVWRPQATQTDPSQPWILNWAGGGVGRWREGSI